jgi:hypothetical protein
MVRIASETKVSIREKPAALRSAVGHQILRAQRRRDGLAAWSGAGADEETGEVPAIQVSVREVAVEALAAPELGVWKPSLHQHRGMSAQEPW